MNYTELSKEVSYALRHAPQEFGLKLDKEGFASIDDLLLSLNTRNDFDRKVSRSDLETMIAQSDKKRLRFMAARYELCTAIPPIAL